MASFIGVEAGDSITVTDTKHQSYTVVINAITEHYTNNYLYMTPQAYEKSFGQAPSYNMVQSVLAQPSEQVQEEIYQIVGKILIGIGVLNLKIVFLIQRLQKNQNKKLHSSYINLSRTKREASD